MKTKRELMFSDFLTVSWFLLFFSLLLIPCYTKIYIPYQVKSKITKKKFFFSIPMNNENISSIRDSLIHY